MPTAVNSPAAMSPMDVPTRVGGRHHRLVAVLCYNREPGVANSDEVRKLFWGRAA